MKIPRAFELGTKPREIRDTRQRLQRAHSGSNASAALKSRGRENRTIDRTSELKAKAFKKAPCIDYEE